MEKFSSIDSLCESNLILRIHELTSVVVIDTTRELRIAGKVPSLKFLGITWFTTSVVILVGVFHETESRLYLLAMGLVLMVVGLVLLLVFKYLKKRFSNIVEPFAVFDKISKQLFLRSEKESIYLSDIFCLYSLEGWLKSEGYYKSMYISEISVVVGREGCFYKYHVYTGNLLQAKKTLKALSNCLNGVKVISCQKNNVFIEETQKINRRWYS